LQESRAKNDELFVFQCLAKGIVKPEEIRTTIGLSEEEFNNA
jgi:hypothetical protein